MLTLASLFSQGDAAKATLKQKLFTQLSTNSNSHSDLDARTHGISDESHFDIFDTDLAHIAHSRVQADFSWNSVGDAIKKTADKVVKDVTKKATEEVNKVKKAATDKLNDVVDSTVKKATAKLTDLESSLGNQASDLLAKATNGLVTDSTALITSTVAKTQENLSGKVD